MSVNVFEHEFSGPWKGKTSIHTGSFINNKWIKGSSGKTIDVFNPTSGKVITKLHEASPQDVDAAVDAAQKAFDTTWGLNINGFERGKLLMKLADLMDKHNGELASIETLDNGKAFAYASAFDTTEAAGCFRYYGGWADKNTGQVIETGEDRLNYTRHEPIGVVGQITPWNFPLLMFSWKVAPALATGNCIVLKPSEFTSLTALKMCDLIAEAGFPPGVVNVVCGYGPTVGQAISEHPRIEKVAFTGSTLVGRSIMKAASMSNLKKVTLELGGKSPTVVFDDADLDQAVNWTSHGIFFNHGQVCCAGSRIFVQSGIYDKFVEKFTAKSKALKLGDPFQADTYQGPQVSQQQFDRIMGYIESGKQQGATLHLGGNRHGSEGYFIEPTIFTDIKPEMKIVQEEIFGPVGVVAKFEKEDDIIAMANDTLYGLAAAVFSRDISRALNTAHKIKAGTVWVNCANILNSNIPFGGFKQSGIGRELGEYALHNYTNVKAVMVNLNMKMN